MAPHVHATIEEQVFAYFEAEMHIPAREDALRHDLLETLLGAGLDSNGVRLVLATLLLEPANFSGQLHRLHDLYRDWQQRYRRSDDMIERILNRH
jgi:hypothetical protein